MLYPCSRSHEDSRLPKQLIRVIKANIFKHYTSIRVSLTALILASDLCFIVNSFLII